MSFLQKQLICCFCQKITKVPLNLDSCSHVICLNCAEIIQMINIPKDDKMRLVCPVCNVITNTQNVSNIQQETSNDTQTSHHSLFNLCHLIIYPKIFFYRKNE